MLTVSRTLEVPMPLFPCATGHMTLHECRLLPMCDGRLVALCHVHFVEEMRHRFPRFLDQDTPQDFPCWTHLPLAQTPEER